MNRQDEVMTDAQYQDHNSEGVCWCVECEAYRQNRDRHEYEAD